MVKLLILITLWRGNKLNLLVGKLQINKDTLIYNCYLFGGGGEEGGGAKVITVSVLKI